MGLLNDIEATFRAELKEPNEQNFAKLVQRVAVATMLGFGRLLLAS